MTELFMDKEWFGEFFVLDHYDKRFPGKIGYSPENRVILTYTITGHDVPTESDVVYGILDDGKKCTLLGKFTPQLSGYSIQNGLPTRRGEVSFSFLLVGEFVTHEDTFSEIDFSLASMQEFFFPYGFKELVKYSNKSLFSLITSYGEIAFRNSTGLRFLDDMNFDVYINNEDAVMEFKKALNDIKLKYKDCLLLSSYEAEYRFFMNIEYGTTILKAYQYICDIANLFAILVYSPVYPESIRIMKGEGANIYFIEVFPSMMLDSRTIEICTKKKTYFHFPINKDNIDLPSVLDFWLNSSKDYQIIVSSIQRETGIRNEHSLYGEIVLYVTQIESISYKNNIKNNKRYEYPLNMYSSNKVIECVRKIFSDIGETNIGKAIADLRNEIAHVGRPKKLLHLLSSREMLCISQCLHITIIGYILNSIGVEKEIISQYQDAFSPNL